MVAATADADVSYREEVEEVKVGESKEEGVSDIELVKHTGRLNVAVREQDFITRETEVRVLRRENVETGTVP